MSRPGASRRARVGQNPRKRQSGLRVEWGKEILAGDPTAGFAVSQKLLLKKTMRLTMLQMLNGGKGEKGSPLLIESDLLHVPLT